MTLFNVNYQNLKENMKINLTTDQNFAIEEIIKNSSCNQKMWNLNIQKMENKLFDSYNQGNKNLIRAIGLVEFGAAIRFVTTKTPSSEHVHHIFVESLYNIGAVQKEPDSNKVSVILGELGVFHCNDGKEAFSLINYLIKNKKGTMAAMIAAAIEERPSPNEINWNDVGAYIECDSLKIKDYALDGFKNYFQETKTQSKNSSHSR